ncbi:hypothetical protein TNCV_1714811 [Trichonephila clavipes]|nr:hypothetical protein TNCV_1714811 [Trichonephila clavipes]
MIPAYNKKRCAAFPFETGIHYRRKTDCFPEEDTTMTYSGFEPTRLQAEGHSHHTGWANVIKFPFFEISSSSLPPSDGFDSPPLSPVLLSRVYNFIPMKISSYLPEARTSGFLCVYAM